MNRPISVKKTRKRKETISDPLNLEEEPNYPHSSFYQNNKDYVSETRLKVRYQPSGNRVSRSYQDDHGRFINPVGRLWY